jgi:hypothetical protein
MIEKVDERVAKLRKTDPRNSLNDLTGSEWVYFLNSVWHTKFKRSGNGAHAYEIRKGHPSPKPPELLAHLISFFTKEGGRVLDPFAGVGSTLLACSITNRTGVGVELNPEYVTLYRDICNRYPDEFTPMTLVEGDSRTIGKNEHVLVNAPYNLVLADPPYGDMLARPKTKSNGNGPTPFTSEEADLGNIQAEDGVTPPYARFLTELRSILATTCDLLVPKGHLVVFCKDFQPTPAHHNLFHADLVSELLKINRLTYLGMRIWNNAEPKLYPFGYPYAFVANQIHQYILIFRREIQ